MQGSTRTLIEFLAWWPPLEWVLQLMWPDVGSRRVGRHQAAPLLACVNLFNICLVAAMTTELAIDGRTKLVWDSNLGEGKSIVSWIGWFGAAYAWENVAEWVWHRTLHLPGLYRNIHWLHHHYKAPEPFDDMLIHPIEAIGYYGLLFAPAFMMPMPVSTFSAYIAIIGVFGIADHSGLRIALPWGIYDAEHHDAHHQHVTTNFGFPSSVIDIACGTFTGNCCGRRFRAAAIG